MVHFGNETHLLIIISLYILTSNIIVHAYMFSNCCVINIELCVQKALK